MKKLLVRVARQSPAMIVAMLALFVALTGTAVATTSALIGSAQIRNNSITGLDVKNRSLRPIDFRGSVRGPRGLRGLTGATGAPGAPGAAGAAGAKGDKGDPGPLLESLPAGKTLRGTYAAGIDATAASRFVSDSISFQVPMPAPLAGHFIAVGAPKPAECPAIGQAAPGNLCVYEQVADNRMGMGIWNTEAGGGGTSPNGAMVYWYSVAAGRASSYGSWAATAPAGASATAGSSGIAATP